MELIEYKTAKLAKEKGFTYEGYDDNVVGYIDGEFDSVPVEYLDKEGFYYAPYQAQLQQWLRDNHNWHIEVNSPDIEGEKWFGHIRIVSKFGNKKELNTYDSYEEVLEQGLVECLNRI